MKAIKLIVPALALVVSGACKDLNVPDFQAQSINALQDGEAGAINIAAVGLLGGLRDFENSFLVSHTALMGQMGREGIELDPSNPQHPLDRLEDPLGANEPRYSGFLAGFRMIRQGNELLAALGAATTLSASEIAGTSGFAKTLMAVAFIRMNNAFDDAGLPIDVDIDTGDPPAAIADNATVKARIISMLDDGATDLGSGGSSFLFPLTDGFSAFDTPASFLTFNRGLRARMAVYTGDFTGALSTYLPASFLDTAMPLTMGAYDTYSTTSGDRANPMFDPTCRQLFSVPENEVEAKIQTDGVSLDQRFLTKVRKFTPKEIHGMVVDACFTLYDAVNGGASSPIAIMRNEELILLRAEANLGAGNVDAALTDINFIRTTSGGLPAIALATWQGMTPTERLDELLYNKRYSLMWEGGHRWVDMRRYGRLADLWGFLPQHIIYPHLPLETNECNQRSPAPAGCAQPTTITPLFTNPNPN